MPNTSATGGALTPTVSPAPLQGNALLDFFHDWIAGITGVAVTNIRPRWQPEPGNIPDEQTDWIAFGITKREADTFAAELHFPSGNGYNEVRRHEVLHLLASFYGPNADNIAHLFREGIQVAQNREVLSLANMGLVESGDIVVAPELLKERWLYRLDMPFSIRRQIVRDYSVLNIQSSQITVNNEHYTTTINV